MKILVCDDRLEQCANITKIIERVRPRCEVRPLSEKALEDALGALFARVGRYIEPAIAGSEKDAAIFDEADLVLLDNNLAHLHMQVRLTAESIAGYIRAFSNAGYIVSLNKNPDVDFDLRYLVGDRFTRADLALNASHLEEAVLWADDAAGDGFRPWYWPVLPEEPDRRRKQVAFVEAQLDEPVLAALSFPPEMVERLSRRSLAPFSRGLTGEEAAEDPAATTFRQLFVNSTRSIPDQADRAGLAKSDDPDVAQFMARVLAADLDLWFRTEIIGAQDVLADLAHIVARMPFLLGEKAGDIAAFDAAALFTHRGVFPEVLDRHLMEATYGPTIWSRRPLFWWPRVKRGEALEPFYNNAQEWADVVFCEDTSNFRARDSKPEPREFVVEIESAFDRRYVAHLKGRHYVPASQLAR